MDITNLFNRTGHLSTTTKLPLFTWGSNQPAVQNQILLQIALITASRASLFDAEVKWKVDDSKIIIKVVRVSTQILPM